MASGTGLQREVCELVDYVWGEASGELRDVLAVSAESIKVEQLDKAEAALLSIKRLLSDPTMDKTKQGVCVCACMCVTSSSVYVCVCVRITACTVTLLCICSC